MGRTEKLLAKFRRQADLKQDVMGIKDSTLQPVFYDSTSEKELKPPQNQNELKEKEKLPPKRRKTRKT